jgi:hypothetical protein
LANLYCKTLNSFADNEALKRIADKKAYQITLLKITTQDNCFCTYQSILSIINQKTDRYAKQNSITQKKLLEVQYVRQV